MTDLHARMAAELDREQLLAEVDRLKAEVERLVAGADQTPTNGHVPNPGQWVAQFLALPGHARRDVASAAIETGRLATACVHDGHASRARLADRCSDEGHESEIALLRARLRDRTEFLRKLTQCSATVREMPDRQLRIEWHGTSDAGYVLTSPHTVDVLVARHNALVRELAEVARERTAAWQAYADVMGEHQAEQAQQRARAAAAEVPA